METNFNPEVRRGMFTTKGDWVVFGWIAAMHVGALAAFFTFSWKALGVALFYGG